MLRNTFLALAATASLAGSSELANSTAQASGDIHLRGPFGHVRVDIDCHCHCRCCRPAVVIAPAPVIVAPAPVFVPPSRCYEIMIRPSPAAPWQSHGTFPTLQGAETAATPMRMQGLEVMIQAR